MSSPVFAIAVTSWPSVAQPEQEPGAADPAAERRDAHAWQSFLRCRGVRRAPAGNRA